MEWLGVTQSMEPIWCSLLIWDVPYGMSTPMRQTEASEVSALPSPTASSRAHARYHRLFEEVEN